MRLNTYIEKILPLYLLAFIISGCSGNKEAKTEESIETTLPTEEIVVTTKKLQTENFEHELVSNGRLNATQVAELRFAGASSNAVITRVLVKNGEHVNAGSPIAVLDTFLLSNSFQQAKNDLNKANLDLQDVLISQGHTISEKQAIPDDVMKLANIRSGYNAAKIKYDLSKYNLENAVLRSPISGTVINLFQKPYNTLDASNAFCSVINENSMEVDFTILENELPLVKNGDKVKIQSYASSDVEVSGNISNINPSVDKDGTVHILATVQHDKRLFNGMNVRISIFRSLGKQWVVPKSAVVLRTGKQVVFALKDGHAAWNYVTTGFENATQYTITSETLHEGDDIIISGNEHLADGTAVKRMEN